VQPSQYGLGGRAFTAGSGERPKVMLKEDGKGETNDGGGRTRVKIQKDTRKKDSVRGKTQRRKRPPT